MHQPSAGYFKLGLISWCGYSVQIMFAYPTTGWVVPSVRSTCSPSCFPTVPWDIIFSTDCRKRNRRRHSTAAVHRVRIHSRETTGSVAPLPMTQGEGFDRDELGRFGAIKNTNVDVKPRAIEPFSLAMSREQVIKGGWAALLGLAYIGGKQDDALYADRKRRLFESITDETTVFRYPNGTGRTVQNQL